MHITNFVVSSTVVTYAYYYVCVCVCVYCATLYLLAGDKVVERASTWIGHDVYYVVLVGTLLSFLCLNKPPNG